MLEKTLVTLKPNVSVESNLNGRAMRFPVFGLPFFRGGERRNVRQVGACRLACPALAAPPQGAVAPQDRARGPRHPAAGLLSPLYVLFPSTGYSLTPMGVIGQRPTRSVLAAWQSRRIEELAPLGAIALGLALGAASLVLYVSRGYSHGMLWLWLSGLVIATAGFVARSRPLPRVAAIEPLFALGAAAVCAPFYLLALYRWPVQVGSDESAVMDAAHQYAHAPGADPFGVSTYLSRPALLFIVWGKLGNLLGGIDLFHMRLLHALVGLLTIAACYVLFRLLLPRNWALFATVLVGINHSMLMISRLAMRENTAVLVLVIAFTLLLWGLRHDNELATFLGGVAAGLGFYVYYPARVTFPIWIVFLIGLAILYRRRFAVRQLLTVGAISAAGFILVATPIVYAESQVPLSVDNRQTGGQRVSLMIYPEGRAEQKAWVYADSEFEGWLKNVEFGLGTFNSQKVDHGWIYVNEGHGFVDPVTGVALWLGVGLVGVALVRRRRDDPGPLLMLGGFAFVFLSLAFVVNKAPNYTRLLVTLPFVAYLVAEAVRWLAGRWRSVRFAPGLIVAVFLAAVVAFNLSAAWDFIQEGRRAGDPIGSTGRYVADRKEIPGEKFFVAASDASPYYVWGGGNRLFGFAEPAQIQAPVDPTTIRFFRAAPPFVLLMRRELWESVAPDLASAYPRGRIRNITPDGARVVLEVPS
jgi:4-amino-4-deoxy-L-arabinose transferase-like glycosyltransferase